MWIRRIMGFLMNSVFGMIRMLIVGGAMSVLLIYKIDDYTKPEYGVYNIIIIVAAFGFIPLFCALFIEFTLMGYRKERRKNKKNKKRLEEQENISWKNHHIGDFF